MSDWLQNNKSLAGSILFLLLFILGVLFIVGSFKNWDWLYKADGSYQNNWSMGQISRYIGRRPARILGFCVGVILSAFTGYILLKSITK
jgi:formate-dependent nitrite reductase membrane component NrfD